MSPRPRNGIPGRRHGMERLLTPRIDSTIARLPEYVGTKKLFTGSNNLTSLLKRQGVVQLETLYSIVCPGLTLGS